MAKKKIRGPQAEQKPPEDGKGVGDVTPESTSGEQLDLIDVTPEILKDILPDVKAYRRVVMDRVELSNKETELRNKIKEKVNKAHLTRLPDGSIRFKVDGFMISIEPTDEKISIKKIKKKGDSEESAE